MHSHSRIQEEPYSPSSLFLHHRGKRERKEMLICSLHIVAYILYIDFFPFSPGFTPLGLCAAVSQRVRRKDWVSHWIVKLVEKLLIRSWFCYCCLLRLLDSTRMDIFCCKTEKRVKEKKRKEMLYSLWSRWRRRRAWWRGRGASREWSRSNRKCRFPCRYHRLLQCVPSPQSSRRQQRIN